MRPDKKAWFHQLLVVLIITGFLTLLCTVATAQSESNKEQSADEQPSAITNRIDIKPTARDEEIAKRLANILKATHWYDNAKVRVEDGVVFLKGQSKTEEHKKWAGNLARKTQDVVAVVNNIEIIRPASWYIQQIREGLQEQWQRILRGLPFFCFALVILFMAWLAGRMFSSYIKKTLRVRQIHPLLAQVISRGTQLFCFLIGLYLILQLFGLTTIALTVLGGTGVIGIILGIAFRDITENLLASVLLSMQNPFRNNDLVEVDGITGYVQKLTIRATVLMTQDGNEVQIPNATVYKSNICNFTTIANRREDFVIGIGYNDSISNAQGIAMRVLSHHPAILNDPEPWVLVETLSATTVDLRIYFWFDASEYHWRKLKSSIIRLVKRAFQDEGISLPGKELTVSFAENVPVELLEAQKISPKKEKGEASSKESGRIATNAEGGLRSEKADIEVQARQSRQTQQQGNLLNSSESGEDTDT
ncbi:mechanosensitive ion channel family protein [Legionella spiritensis]|uniref:Small-conductance mechanosensitive channel n=1 Tax=Legionella spiritensis TaxID=452 RepID=A0A0W0Z5D7_LEGSP|nr:mechanosensitive ion channel family protein [Legionella spiritensis]KTD64322.1 mechanosensitive ion channel MscS [Legionella spiritensis]SNV46607.1 mechanosensitive ion channel MscS [Legionella spiritensis]